MHITSVNILGQYRRLLSLSQAERESYFCDTMLQPFFPMLHRLQIDPTPAGCGCLPVWGRDLEMLEMLEVLEQHQVEEQVQSALELAVPRLVQADIPMPPQITVGVFIGDPAVLGASQGYTGIGSIPGYIQIIVAPNSHNISRISSCAVHELHHNALFHNTKWDFYQEVTLARYLVLEGLAESFAADIFGMDSVGPWVSDITPQQLLVAKQLIAPNLAVTGFEKVAPYIFGDPPGIPDSHRTGMPYCGGYAVGFHAVQAFLREHGFTVEQSTLLDGNDIMANSGYF